VGTDYLVFSECGSQCNLWLNGHIFCVSKFEVNCKYESSQFHFWTFGFYCKREIFLLKCFNVTEIMLRISMYVGIYIYVCV